MKSAVSITKKIKSVIIVTIMFCVSLGILNVFSGANMVQAAEDKIFSDKIDAIDVNDDIQNDFILSNMQPKTGDESNVVIYIVLLVAAAGGALVLMVLKKKNDDDDESEDDDNGSEE